MRPEDSRCECRWTTNDSPKGRTSSARVDANRPRIPLARAPRRDLAFRNWECPPISGPGATIGSRPRDRRRDVAAASVLRLGNSVSHEAVTPRLLSREQAGLYAGCSVDAIDRLINAGHLSVVSLP